MTADVNGATADWHHEQAMENHQQVILEMEGGQLDKAAVYAQLAVMHATLAAAITSREIAKNATTSV
ncbi:hypothetical protein [Prescottella subtropica]|uniref:hypothetical protein n=1 Tax=Prescottella subtropica TaxID=2545757 RepID=UPI0010F462CE|nr:hypothetical protein [Prescottella subtropica]